MESKGTLYHQTTVVDKELAERYDGRISSNDTVVEKKLKILFMSRVEKPKGIFELIQAISVLKRRYFDVELVVAGNGGDLDSAKSLTIDLGLQSTVKFVGFVGGIEKAKYLNDSDIFCLPSYTEGMPNAVLEAMCFGLPVVCTPVGALKDLVTNDLGTLVPVKSVDSLVQAFIEFFDDELLLLSSGTTREFAKERFLSDTVSARLISTYRNML